MTTDITTNIDEIINGDVLSNEMLIHHQHIKDCGKYDHDAIDHHIENITNAHFGQDLTQHGNPIFNSLKIKDAYLSNHVVTKAMLDNVALGLLWQKSIKEICDINNLINNKNIKKYSSDRFIASVTSGKYKKNFIYEYDGNKFTEIKPQNGFTVYVENGIFYKNENITFNGTEWVRIGSIGNHDSINGCGIYSHKDIDEHIQSKLSHFGQDLSVSSEPQFANLNISNTIISKNISTENINTSNSIHIGKQNNILSDLSIMTDDKLNVSYLFSHPSDKSINILHMRSLGTYDNKKPLETGTPIASYLYAGYDGNKFKPTGIIQCVATEDYNISSNGSALRFATTENGSTIPKINMSITDCGTVICHNTQNGDSHYDPSLIVLGGVAIYKDASVYQSINIGSNIIFNTENSKSFIKQQTTIDSDNKIISLCGASDDNPYRCSSVIVSGKDSTMMGDIKLTASAPIGKINMYTNGVIGAQLDEHGKFTIASDEDATTLKNASTVINGGLSVNKTLLANNITCLNKCKLPIYENDPEGEIGMIYYNSISDTAKVFTKRGWLSITLS